MTKKFVIGPVSRAASDSIVLKAGSAPSVTRPRTTVNQEVFTPAQALPAAPVIMMPKPGSIAQAASPSLPAAYADIAIRPASDAVMMPGPTSSRTRINSADFPKAMETALRSASAARAAAPVTTFPRPTVVVVNPFGTPPPHNIGMQSGGGQAEGGGGGGGGGGGEEYDEEGPKQPPLPDVHVSNVPWWLYAAVAYLAYKTFTK